MADFFTLMRPVPVTLLTVLTVLAWKSGAGRVRWLCTGLLVSSVTFHFFRETFQTGNVVAAALAFALLVPIPYMLWLLAETIFDDEFVVRRRHWIGFGITSLMLFVAGGRTYIHRETRDVPLYYVTALLAVLICCGLAALTLRAATRNLRTDLIESRRIIRVVLLGTAGCNVLFFMAVQVINFTGGGNYVEHFSSWLTMTGSINLLIAIMLVAEPSAEFFGAPSSDLAKVVEPAEEKPTTDLRQIIDRVMSDGLYRQEDLSIKSLALASKVPEYKVRKVIRDECCYRNFNQYVNGFRVKEAASRLLAGDEDKIMAIAFEVGFNSIAPFNRAFREVYGVTPSAYRRQKNLKTAG